jgi:hypothetical protein
MPYPRGPDAGAGATEPLGTAAFLGKLPTQLRRPPLTTSDKEVF